MDASNLDKVFVGNLIEVFLVIHQFRKFDVDGASQSSSQVSGARGDVTEVLIMTEFADGLDVGGSSAQSIEDFGDSSTRLHGNNSKLIFFIDPNKESLCVIVENTSAGGPVAIQVASLEEAVTLFE